MTDSSLNIELLRFTTAGSVDDGKSTLIGRLLYDSKSIFEDQLAAVKASSEKKGLKHLDLSLLTDGLRAEREQGITIDVAYRYFATPKREFIIADAPGHTQYTRNMITGASTANLALILIDARKGMTEQTCRHSFIASLLKIPHLIVCVNKMDLVEYNEEVYNKIVTEYKNFASRLDVKDIGFVPISALHGDNVVDRSGNMQWYKGESLLHTLENVQIDHDHNLEDARFPVQYVIRPHCKEYPDYRGYAGRIAAGIFKPGDEVVALPSGLASKIRSIETLDGKLDEAFAPMSVSITLEDELDISRGDMLVKKEDPPQNTQDVDIMLCWLNNRPPQPGASYFLKHTANETRAVIREINYKIDISTLDKINGDKTVAMNDIFHATVRTAKPVFTDSYKRNRITGSLILIDAGTNETVAAGMIQ